jgi:hypothetical protein
VLTIYDLLSAPVIPDLIGNPVANIPCACHSEPRLSFRQGGQVVSESMRLKLLQNNPLIINTWHRFFLFLLPLVAKVTPKRPSDSKTILILSGYKSVLAELAKIIIFGKILASTSASQLFGFVIRQYHLF